MNSTIWILVILAILWLYAWVQRLLLILAEPLRHPSVRIIDRHDIPDLLGQLLEQHSQGLKELGFYFSHALESEEIDGRVNLPSYTLVFYHPRHLCFAEVTSADLPDQAAPADRSFRTVFTDGESLLTCNFTLGLHLPPAPGQVLQDTAKLMPDRQLQSHLDARGSMPATSNPQRPTLMSAVDHRAHYQRSLHQALDHMVERGAAKPAGGHLKLSLKETRAVISRLTKTMKQRKAAAKRLVEATDKDQLPDISVAEDFAYQKMTEALRNHKLGTVLKLVVFLASVTAFGLFFGFFTSFWFLPVLFAVLLFHELGHLLAMKVFGYRDLQILFLPIGAAALGANEQATGLQRTLVYLAGPVPGMLLAAALMWALAGTGDGMATDSPWLLELIVMLLLINYINLLPVMPLDGGQIVNLVLFERSPRAHMAFLVVSALVFAAAAWALDFDPLLVVLAIVTGLMAYGRLGSMTLARQLREQGGDSGIETRQIFKAMHHPDYATLNFGERMTLAKGFIDENAMPPVKLGHKLISAVLYLSALALPLGLAYQTYQSMIAPTNWQEELASATGSQRNELLIRAGRVELYGDDASVGRDYLQQALDADDPPLSASQRREVFSILISAAVYRGGNEFDHTTVGPWLTELSAEGPSQELANTYLVLSDAYSVGHRTGRRYAVKALETSTNLDDPSATLRAHLAIAGHDMGRGDFSAADQSISNAWQLRGVDDGVYRYALMGSITDRYALSGEILRALPEVDQLLAELAAEDFDPDLYIKAWICLLGRDMDCTRQQLGSLSDEVEAQWQTLEDAWSQDGYEFEQEYLELERRQHFGELALLQTLLKITTSDSATAQAAWTGYLASYAEEWQDKSYYEEVAEQEGFEGLKARRVLDAHRRFGSGVSRDP